jgi:HSP20 family protein
MKLVRLGNPHCQVRKSLVDELFDSFLYNDYHERYFAQPATNVFETENDFRLQLAIPGLKKEEVSLNFQNDLLTVKAEVENKTESQSEESRYLRKEFRAFNFEKQYNVPETVDVEKISAKFENGILQVILPKKEKTVEKSPLPISIS